MLARLAISSACSGMGADWLAWQHIMVAAKQILGPAGVALNVTHVAVADTSQSFGTQCGQLLLF